MLWGRSFWPSLQVGHQLRENVPRHVMLLEAGSVQCEQKSQSTLESPLQFPSEVLEGPSSGLLWPWTQTGLADAACV